VWEIDVGSNDTHRRFRYDWRRSRTYGFTKVGPPPAWLIVAVSLALALPVFLGWLIGGSPARPQSEEREAAR
jgi:hypothetical protein